MRARSAPFIRLLRKTTASEKAKGETPTKKYSNFSPDALGFSVAKQHKKCPIDFSVLALGKIYGIFYLSEASLTVSFRRYMDFAVGKSIRYMS